MKKNLLFACLCCAVIFAANAQYRHKSLKNSSFIKAEQPALQESKLVLDAGVTKHYIPLFIQKNVAVTISGIIHNYGINPITSMRLNYSVNSSAPVTDVLTSVNVDPEKNYHFIHSNTWTPTHNGAYTLKVWVDQLNGSADMNNSNDTLVLRPQAVDSVAVKVPLYEEFKQVSCNPCYLACPNMDSVFTKNKNRANLIEYHVDWPGVDYMNDVTEKPFANPRVYYYGVENYGVPDGQMDGTETTDNVDPSSVGTSDIQKEINMGSPFRISATATYTPSNDTYGVNVSVRSYIGTKSTMKLKLHCVLILDTIKYAKDQSTEDPQSGFAPPLGTTSGGDPDNTYKYVTVFPDVAEDMIPDTVGTVISPFTAFTTKSFTLSWKKNHPWGFCPGGSGCVDNGTGSGGTVGSGNLVNSKYDSVGNHVHLVLFVQSDSSKYVYQSLSVIPSIPTGIDELAQNQDLNIYPNPANGLVNVSFNLEQAQNVNMEVYNMVGQKIYADNIGKISSGKHVMSFDSKGFAPGIYLVRLTTDNSTVTKKLIVE